VAVVVAPQEDVEVGAQDVEVGAQDVEVDAQNVEVGVSDLQGDAWTLFHEMEAPVSRVVQTSILFYMNKIDGSIDAT
jgi:hypothetical protein